MGDWVWLFSKQGIHKKGIQENATPYRVTGIALGPDGHWYAQFYETTTGWRLDQCEKAEPPPSQEIPAGAAEDFSPRVASPSGASGAPHTDFQSRDTPPANGSNGVNGSNGAWWESPSAAPPPAFASLTASALWCATCGAAVRFRTLLQLDKTEVYLCEDCDTEVGHKPATAPASTHGTQASHDVLRAAPASSDDDVEYDGGIL